MSNVTLIWNYFPATILIWTPFRVVLNILTFPFYVLSIPILIPWNFIGETFMVLFAYSSLIVSFVIIQQLTSNTSDCADSKGRFSQGFLIYGVFSTLFGSFIIWNISTIFTIPWQLLGFIGYVVYWDNMYQRYTFCGDENI